MGDPDIEETAMTAFEDALTRALVINGTIGNLKAQMRAASIQIIKGTNGFPKNNNINAPTDDPHAALAYALVSDFLTSQNLSLTKGVFTEEANLGVHCPSYLTDDMSTLYTQDIASDLKLDDAASMDKGTHRTPLLMQLLQKYFAENNSQAKRTAATHSPPQSNGVRCVPLSIDAASSSFRSEAIS